MMDPHADALLKIAVHEDLDSANEGGYGEFMRDRTELEIAEDMCDKAPSAEGFTPEQIEPHVKSWFELHPEVTRRGNAKVA